MSHAMRPFIVSVTLATLLLSTSALASDEADVVFLPPSASPVVAASEEGEFAVSPKARTNPLGLKPIDSTSLAKRRGGAEGISEMHPKGVVADNRAVNVSTGNNVISDSAFQGSSGLPMVVQNTGNNVLIQNATIVNVQLK